MNQKIEFSFQKITRYIFIIVALFLLLWLNYNYLQSYLSSNSEFINSYQGDADMNNQRQSAVAGVFYPIDAKTLEKEIENYISSQPNMQLNRAKLFIVPHAGYQYSASVAAGVYKDLQKHKDIVRNVIIVGPSHYVGLRGAALSGKDSFKTPLGVVAINKEINNELLQNPLFSNNDDAHQKEHSIEVQIPFLQKALSNFSIIPIVYGDISAADLNLALMPYLAREDTVIIFSADLSHYLSYDDAKKLDEQTTEMIKSENPQIAEHMSCGAIGINAAILLAKAYNLKPHLLQMANSGDVGSDKNHVVGYASFAYSEPQAALKKPLSKLEQEIKNLHKFALTHGEALLKVAKNSLEDSINHHVFHPSRRDYDDVLFNKGAAFVTITKKGDLRGCIGSLIPSQAVVLDVAQNTYKASQEDNRFSPITKDELKDLKLSISLLSDFEQIKFLDEADLLSQLNAGVDGLVIRDGNRQGVFLPSVWQQLPNKEEFLKNLKLKAGMSPSYWSNKIKAYRFRVVEIKRDAD